MKECTGKELHIGDVVLFMTPGYRDMSWGRVKRLTPKTVLVHYYSSYKKSDGTHSKKEFRSTPDQLIKIEINQVFECANDPECSSYEKAKILVENEILELMVHQIENDE